MCDSIIVRKIGLDTIIFIIDVSYVACLIVYFVLGKHTQSHQVIPNTPNHSAASNVITHMTEPHLGSVSIYLLHELLCMCQGVEDHHYPQVLTDYQPAKYIK